MEQIRNEQTRVVPVFHDVTQRRQAAEAMRHASAIVDSSADAILGKTPDGGHRQSYIRT
jgi:PAS domain-containing protein